MLRGAARLLAGHGFPDKDIAKWLTDAAGDGWSRVAETIAWGIANGRQKPLRNAA